MSEEKPRIVQVEATPLDPATLTTEHGFKPNFPVYEGEQDRVLDPDQANVMATASKESSELAIQKRKEAEMQIKEADSSNYQEGAAARLNNAERALTEAESATQEADRIATETSKKYVENEIKTQKLNEKISSLKNQ